MKIEQKFALERPRDDVWAFFQDVPAVARCLPGAEYLGQKDDGSYIGKIEMKVGPFQASFEGAANVKYDNDAYTVDMSGKGVDKRGASRGKLTMNCALLDEGFQTRVKVDADLQLSGSIAQFGRTGIVQEIAATLIADFVSNVETALTPVGATGDDVAISSVHMQAKPASKPISGIRILWLSLRNWIHSLFGARP